MKLRLPLVSVSAVPTLTWNSTPVVIAEVPAGDATGTGWTYGPTAVGGFLRNHLAPLVEGRGALDIPAAHDAMCRAVRNAGRPGVAACAISALDIAHGTPSDRRRGRVDTWTPRRLHPQAGGPRAPGHARWCG
ncbi:hypothetical protein [Streptomyces sp. uw30]|uniref:hypothetical protein n=1 Tax=Streptomyces sp. uw30 TaxID=1828179 RepID=UPI002905BE44|nr:hypothetical protein [Streptomyces sp. uw30]